MKIKIKGFTLRRTRLNRNLVNIKGFTLIELLIVMTIIGLLAGLSLFALRGARESARDARRKADLETIRSGLEIYKADCDSYPGSVQFGGTLRGDDSSGCPTSNVYIQEVPQDVLTGRNYSYLHPPGLPGAPVTTYTLCTALEDETTFVSNCGSCGATCSYIVRNP